jgi:hypothetical protein
MSSPGFKSDVGFFLGRPEFWPRKMWRGTGEGRGSAGGAPVDETRLHFV